MDLAYAFVPTRAFRNPKVLGFVPLRGEISCLLSPVLSSDKNKIYLLDERMSTVESACGESVPLFLF